MQTSFTVSPYWDTRAMKPDGTSRLMLTINVKDLPQFRFVIKLSSTKSVFDKATSGKGGSDEVKEFRKLIQEQVLKAETILDKLDVFNKDAFINYFKTGISIKPKQKLVDVYSLFQDKIDALIQEDRIGYADNVKGSLHSFRNYKKSLRFSDVDESFLKGYKAWMISKGCSPTTYQMYLRNLRTVYNQAVKDGLFIDVAMPFKNFKIGTSAKSKSVLYPSDIKALFEYEAVGIRASRAKDFFIFCYLSNGMNFQDAAHLKFSNIKGDMLCFVRRKTRTTNSVVDKQINVYLHPEAIEIIKRWGNVSKKPNDYIFPILNNAVGALKQSETFKRYRRVSNKMLRQIGEDLGFSVKLCLNLARHSFGTRLKLDGVSVSFISDAMGHSSSKTTEHYLKSIPDDKYKEMSSRLLEF
ncbi:MAG: site-specific integrase [Pedobacter sp.]|nr:site-specific integrase [Chitinophagaceae bacterium]